jgi:hypothetical protein
LKGGVGSAAEAVLVFKSTPPPAVARTVSTPVIMLVSLRVTPMRLISFLLAPCPTTFHGCTL